MIDFSTYIGQHIVLMTNNFLHPEELLGIRDKQSKVFKYGGTYVLVRPLTTEDVKDEDFIQWLHSMWSHEETNIKNFVKNAKRHEHAIKAKATPRNV